MCFGMLSVFISFYVLAEPFITKNYLTKIQKTNEDNSTVWVDQEMLDISFAFVGYGNLNHAFVEVGSSSDWRLLPLGKIRGLIENTMDVSFLFMNGYFIL